MRPLPESIKAKIAANTTDKPYLVTVGARGSRDAGCASPCREGRPALGALLAGPDQAQLLALVTQLAADNSRPVEAVAEFAGEPRREGRE